MPSALRLASLTLLLAAVGLVSPANAVRQQPPADRALPDFDIREGRAPQAASPQAQAEIERATQNGPRRARVHPFTSGVRILERPGVSVRPTAPAAALRNVVASLANRLGLDDNDLGSLELLRDYVTQSNGLRTVTFAQTVDGIPVHEAVVTIHVDRSGDIVRVTSSAGRAAGRRGGQIAVEQAVKAAAANVRPELPFAATRTNGADGNAAFARGRFRRDLTASLTWLPVDGVLRLAWHVTIEPESDSELYDVLVDAATGEVLLRQNRVHFVDGAGRVMQSAAMNALDPRRLDPTPVGQPGTGCPPPTNYFVRSLNAPFRDPATVLNDSGRLSGNNAHVFRSAPANEGAMGTFDGTKWNFDFPFNSPDSAETALFYSLNFAHDFFYNLGFDEAAGNFQVDNFNRGGKGGDPIKGNARANGRNNANYMNAADGTSPRINMFLWDTNSCWGEDLDFDGIPDIDGDFDFDIIIHEYHHGVSLRLAQSWGGSEAGAMGEGGGDFFAYSVNGNTQLAEYVLPGGLRTVNAKTYAEWTCTGGFFCDVHDNGELWANVLWDTRERLRIDRVRGTEASGINEAHQLYIDALKLAPPTPTMLDMRDAMLLDDGLRNPAGTHSANFCRLWESFAGRGMGVAALDTADAGFNSVVADFSVPDGCNAPPSLQIVTVTANVPTANEAGPVPGSFRLMRNVISSDPITVQYSLTGTAVNGTDYVTAPLAATIPAGAAFVVVPIVPVDDTLVEVNETALLRLRSGGPYVIGSPSSATVTIVSDDVAPDLSISSLSVPARGASGLVIQVTDTTTNLGTGVAPASTTSLYLSSNLVLDTTDPLVGSRVVPELAPGSASTGTMQVTLPDGLSTGQYTLFAVADAPGTIGESKEYNNSRAGFMQVGPDITLTALSAPSTAGAGSTILVSDTTANSGMGTASASVTRFYLSEDFNLDSGDQLLQGRNVPALDGGNSSSGSTNVTIPASTHDGNFYLIAKADGTDAVPECSETNNTRTWLIRIGPDLVVSAATAPSRAAAGLPVDVTETTQNSGTGNAAASVTAIYLSTNTLLDSADQRLGSRSVPTLGPGGASAKTTSVTLPAISAGTWYLIVSADDDRAITETVETNNTRAVTILVGPDLSVASFTLPFTLAAGATVSVGDSVKNVGAATAGASVIRFYLSANTLFESGDTLLGERTVGSISPNLTNGGTTSLTIPSGLSGTYYIFAIADGTNLVQEASEGNNSFLRLVQITGGQ
jgi:subtilase family serine protease